jgi:hypothetical protein
MSRANLLHLISLLAIPTLPFLLASCGSSQVTASQPGSAPTATPQNPGASYLGFDRNIYPGDDALPILRKSFVFAGYWVGPPPGEKINTWRGKRELMKSLGFGFAVLYRGRETRELKTEAKGKEKGELDARGAAGGAKEEGFVPGTVIFLDIEEGGRLPPAYHAYLRTWADELTHAGYRPGVYCSAIPASEGHGVTILTSDDIRNNIGHRDIVYWVYNDVCPPSPGCVAPQNPPPVSAGGVSYAAIWQFVQSPRRKEYTARCATTYNADGNCYAPGDTSHAWFLDVNSASTADPSAAK